MISQNEMILAYLKAGFRITPREALDKFGCFRLGARIADLKKEGHRIESKIITQGRKHFAEYKLLKEGMLL